jgi:hypothetical protein
MVMIPKIILAGGDFQGFQGLSSLKTYFIGAMLGNNNITKD